MLHALLRRDRVVVLAGLVAVIMLAWAYLILGAGIEMDEMDMGGGQIMIMAPSWTFGYAALIFLMWAIMMVAMMLPSAAPTILLVSALARDRIAPVAVPFACGYVRAAA
jgi:predicted metal-binding membrane protein